MIQHFTKIQKKLYFSHIFFLSAFPEVMTGAGLEDVRRGVCDLYKRYAYRKCQLVAEGKKSEGVGEEGKH